MFLSVKFFASCSKNNFLLTFNLDVASHVGFFVCHITKALYAAMSICLRSGGLSALESVEVMVDGKKGEEYRTCNEHVNLLKITLRVSVSLARSDFYTLRVSVSLEI